MLKRVLDLSKVILEMILSIRNHALSTILGKRKDMEYGIWDVVKTKRIHFRRKRRCE